MWLYKSLYFVVQETEILLNMRCWGHKATSANSVQIGISIKHQRRNLHPRWQFRRDQRERQEAEEFIKLKCSVSLTFVSLSVHVNVCDAQINRLYIIL